MANTPRPFDMSPAQQRIAGAAREEGPLPAAAATEVTFLQHKLKSLRGVSTIFRQKIALIMRECAKNPAAFPEYQKMYAKVLAEVTTAEEEIDKAQFPNAETAKGISSAAAPRPTPTADERRQRHSDVEKAHHLCRVLAEKNEIKAREVELRQRFNALHASYDELKERYARIVEQPQLGAEAQLDAFRNREMQLEKMLMDAKTQLAAAVASTEPKTTPIHGVPGTADSDSNLVKQNALLKNRIERLKSELSRLSELHEADSRQLHVHVETLMAQLHSVKHESESKDARFNQLRLEHLELEAELERERRLVGLMQSKLATYEGENRRLLELVESSRSRRSRSSTPSNELTNPTTAVPTAEEYEKVKAAAAEWESRARQLEDQLETLQSNTKAKDGEIAVLGAQIKAFRSRIDAFETERDQREVHQTMVQDVETRLLAAVDAITNSQTAVNISEKIEALNEHVKAYEGLEMQLRQKEDMLALAEDELAQAKAAQKELVDSLAAVSTLFSELPQTVASLERLVIEHAAYKDELHRCAESRSVPDVVGTQDCIELRCLEAEAARSRKRQQQREIDPVTSPIRRRGSPGVASEYDVPSPPPLLDIVDVASRREAEPRGDSVERVSADDARITFQLFDERGAGTLPADALGLCLTTLGLPVRLLPAGAATMTQAEFVSLCVNRPHAA